MKVKKQFKIVETVSSSLPLLHRFFTKSDALGSLLDHAYINNAAGMPANAPSDIINLSVYSSSISAILSLILANENIKTT